MPREILGQVEPLILHDEALTYCKDGLRITKASVMADETGERVRDLISCLLISNVPYPDICETLTNFTVEDSIWNLVSDRFRVLMMHHGDDE